MVKLKCSVRCVCRQQSWLDDALKSTLTVTPYWDKVIDGCANDTVKALPAVQELLNQVWMWKGMCVLAGERRGGTLFTPSFVLSLSTERERERERGTYFELWRYQ